MGRGPAKGPLQSARREPELPWESASGAQAERAAAGRQCRPEEQRQPQERIAGSSRCLKSCLPLSPRLGLRCP